MLERPINRDFFTAYVEQMLVPHAALAATSWSWTIWAAARQGRPQSY
jgi:hypothetical protein